MIKFLKITQAEANTIASNPSEIYTPGYSQIAEYYWYKELYDVNDEENTMELTYEQADGLTPINPNKPMFPRKK